MNSISGRTRSIPGMSADGNDSPTSMISKRPSTSRHAMLRPTSPTPPRKTSLQSASGKETGVLEGGADPGGLLCGGGHERQARRAGAAAEHVERGLHRDRVRRDEQRIEQRRELLVDLASGRHISRRDQVEHLVDLAADQMAGDAHDADSA